MYLCAYLAYFFPEDFLYTLLWTDWVSAVAQPESYPSLPSRVLVRAWSFLGQENAFGIRAGPL